MSSSKLLNVTKNMFPGHGLQTFNPRWYTFSARVLFARKRVTDGAVHTKHR